MITEIIIDPINDRAEVCINGLWFDTTIGMAGIYQYLMDRQSKPRKPKLRMVGDDD